MADDTRDELRSLRERAFGRHPDIHDDPAALERLYELEHVVGSSRPEPEATPAPAAAPDAADRVGGQPADADSGGAPAATSAPRAALERPQSAATGPAATETSTVPTADAAADASGDRPRRLSLRVAWALSLVAAIALTAVATTAILAPGHTRVAVLQTSADQDWSTDFFGPSIEDAVIFEEHYGLTPIAFEQSWTRSEGVESHCLYVVSRDSGAGDEMVGGGCGVGGFSAAATLAVVADAPEPLRERYGEGTALRFVLDGSQVVVYSDTP
ncbi:hypothetical protein P0L94_15025 [Microbacter sp. GSS18]|nr:hypothetical protein P0L94_15025 [Microbacter sp. GSS18]